MNRTDTAAFTAGVAAGIAGLLVFLALHALWIVPIWFILPVGLLVAGGGGLAVGWAYAELKRRLPRRPWTALAVVGVIAVILAPAFVLAELQAPVFTVTPAGPAQTVATSLIVARFAGELLATATIVGGLVGWWLGRTRRAALATAVAGFVFALGPGHNIPFIGGTPGVAKELAIMAAVTLVAALVLVEGHAWLAVKLRRRGNP
jgi:xanthosine utilization system XapX-like protein